MDQNQRLNEISQIVKQNKRVMVSGLSKQFGVTTETIRRDLEKLETSGLIERVHGGAVLNSANYYGAVDFAVREDTNNDGKNIIAALAEPFILDNSTVAVDSSTTSMEVLKYFFNKTGITVLTYSVKAIECLFGSNVRLISTGGTVDYNIYAFCGSSAQEILEMYRTDITLISCKALNKNGGIYDSFEEEAKLKRIMAKRGNKVILLADHLKFDHFGFAMWAELDDIDVLITDEKPSEEWITLLNSKKVQLIYPEKQVTE